MSKFLRMIAIIGLAITIFVSSVLLVAAQGPDGANPNSIPYIDGQTHTLGANASAWYRFEYGKSSDTGVRAVAVVRLVNGNNSGVVFEMWPPETVSNTTDNKPVGKGTPTNIDCNTGLPSDQGQCQTTDLIWSGGFGASGSYFVRVINKNNNPVNFLLTVEGPTVNTPPNPSTTVAVLPTIAPPPVVAVVPTAPVVPAEPPVIANMDDPWRATYMDNQPHKLGGNQAVWYLFDYSAQNNLGERLTAGIRLINGKDSGVRFEVWTPQAINEWWTKQPVGRGTVSPADSPDLSWRGAFNTGGTYLVRVVNDSNSTVTFLLVQE